MHWHLQSIRFWKKVSITRFDEFLFDYPKIPYYKIENELY